MIGLAVLSAFEQVGNTEDLTTVEKLIANEGIARKKPDLVTEANRILPALRELAKAEQQRSVLLRPAGAPAEEFLLRPAAGAPANDESLLLRPALVSDSPQE